MGKTGTLASTALAWFQHTGMPALICTYSHMAAGMALRRLAELAPQLDVCPQQLAYLRDYNTGPPDPFCYHAFTRAGLDSPLSKKHGKAKNPFLRSVLDDIGAGHTAVVVTTALWSDYLRQRVPGGEPAWAARFGLVLVDEASQATESQAATALRWARDGARMGLWGHTKQLGPHRRDGARPPTSWDGASDSLMAQLALRLDGSTEVRVVLASSYRAPSSVMHIYSSCTYQGELRSAPSNHKKYAPPGMA